MSVKIKLLSYLWIATTKESGKKRSYFSGGLICQVWLKKIQLGVVHMPQHTIDCSDRPILYMLWGLDLAKQSLRTWCCSFGDAKKIVRRSKGGFRLRWQFWSLFAGWIDALGWPPVSAIRISQVVAVDFQERTAYIWISDLKGLKRARNFQVVARTGLTVLLFWREGGGGGGSHVTDAFMHQHPDSSGSTVLYFDEGRTWPMYLCIRHGLAA